jgi:hypothetical protein
MIGSYHTRLATFAVQLLLVTSSAHPQATRNLGPHPPLSDNGKYYAIVIGINKYQPPLSTLITPVNDARAIAAVLTESYGFQVKLLLNQDATRVNILDAIVQFRDTLNENDSLLIYYAGHGYSDHASDKAYWLPVDADSVYSSNRIIADELTTDVRVQNARHVLIISDSCYSGGLARDADTPTESAGRMVFLDRMYRSRSRTLMASGGDEPVSDSGTDGHSVFAYAVLRSLQQAGQSVFTASDLFYSSVRQQVAGKSEQLPQYSIIRNSSHDDGDFVFVKKQAGLHSLATDQASAAQHPADSFVMLSAPVGAEIHVDQQFSGHSTGSPSRIKVQPGQHTVEVFLAGYLPWKQLVVVESGKRSDVVASLAPVRAVDTPPIASTDSNLNTKPAAAISDADLAQIRQLLTQYESAVNNKDVRQLKSIWPEIPPKKLDQYKGLPRDFRIRLTLTLATLLEGNENAIVKCKQSYEINGPPRPEDNVTFYVGRFNSGWIINQIPSSN